jgi:beta-barrel assembly-enhancing protease
MCLRWGTLGLLALFICLGTASAPTAARADDAQPFAFTRVDLELLQKSNESDRQMEQRGLLYPDAELAEYVSAIGHDVLPAKSDSEHVVWQFRVLSDPVPNAFALPNGSIYVNTGLLALLENEAQLASVLAHEETHVLHRHGYLENRSARKKILAATIVSGVADAGIGFGGYAGGAAGAVIGVAAPAVLVSTIYGYSRELEKEADIGGLTASNNANYSTEEMVAMLKLLDSSHEVDLSTPNFYQDHPKLKDRIEYVSALSNSTHSITAHPMVQAERYVQITGQVRRDNVAMDIDAGRARTALFEAQRLVIENPRASENFRVLGDAWMALGPRTPEPTPQERSSQGRGQERKMEAKLTPQEYENALMAAPVGKAAWEVNRTQSEDAYNKAVEIAPNNGDAHRGLGLLYEKEQLPLRCASEFQKYLELMPDASDAPQIRRRLQRAQKSGAVDVSAVAKP